MRLALPEPGGDDCVLVGMVHLLALPGSPGHGEPMSNILGAAMRDAERLLKGGADALLVENMGDLPYLRGQASPETVAAMAIATHELARLGKPVGVQILAGANLEALAVAVAGGASFIRVEAFAYAHVADEGWLDASAGPLLRARRSLGAEVSIWADVKKKHASHAVTADLSLGDVAKGSAFAGADAVIVTGKETGAAAELEDVRTAAAAGLPVLVGSGVTPGSAPRLRTLASGVIVGTALKEDGDWRRPVAIERVRALKEALCAR